MTIRAPMFDPRPPKGRPIWYQRDRRGFWYVIADGNTFLDQFQIREGDVLLTRATAKYSHVIARATGGPFSHAALVNGFGVVLEADENGTARKVLTRVGAVALNGGTTCILRLENCDRVAVYRHPESASQSHIVPASSYSELLMTRRGEQYPPYDVLSEPLKATGVTGASAKALLRTIQKLRSIRDRITAPGMFCSQLVATYFQIMGLPLWANGDLVPAQVSPNDLARQAIGAKGRRNDHSARRPTSKLVPVFGAVVKPQATQWLRDYRSFDPAELKHRSENGEDLDDHERHFLSGQLLRGIAEDGDAKAARLRRAGVPPPDVSASNLIENFESCPLVNESLE